MPFAADSRQYRSCFSSWENRSSVRAKPRRVLEELEAGKVFFPPELVPALYHPMVREREEEVIKSLLLQRLYIYLDFTADLEQLVVSPVTQLISRRRSGFDLPDEMVRDSYRICTDEAWHAQFSDDLQEQLIAATRERPCAARQQPYFLTRLEALKDGLEPQYRPLADLFFTVVSETLISSILSGIPKDQRVCTVVRETIADHAEDEGRHHAYFVKFFEYAWPQLTDRERDLVGALLPEFTLAFLRPDVDAAHDMLRFTGLDFEAVTGVVEETYPDGRLRAEMRAAAASTLRLFERNGVFESSKVADSFFQCGLLG
ncbi:diiron oxygenase [Streptomyces sp. NPDC031705]|uniref:diiron oxygenase n=1 Tax=unclassified Streptomyces TaxID=2593676 RepID=UPI0033F3A18E